MKPIYLDYNATSPLHPEVREKIQVCLSETFGNPSSLHAEGRQARSAVEAARTVILKALGDPKGKLVFTSGGTESGNLALKGVAGTLRSKGRHLVVSSIEHNAVLRPARALEEEGWELTVVPVDGEGRVDPAQVARAIRPDTALVSVMQANNETGGIQPVEEIGRLAREKGILFHTDAVQSFGKIPFDVARMPVDLVSISAHKLGGLKGAGALYFREGIKIQPMIHGGPQEKGVRSGTENVIGIVGFSAAVEATWKEKEEGGLERIGKLRDRLENGLKERVKNMRVNGGAAARVPGTANLSFSGCDRDSLLMALDRAGIQVSAGSACVSGSTQPSHVLVAMGLPPEQIRGSIRFSVGWGTTEAEIEQVLEIVPPVIERVRAAHD